MEFLGQNNTRYQKGKDANLRAQQRGSAELGGVVVGTSATIHKIQSTGECTLHAELHKFTNTHKTKHKIHTPNTTCTPTHQTHDPHTPNKPQRRVHVRSKTKKNANYKFTKKAAVSRAYEIRTFPTNQTPLDPVRGRMVALFFW